MIPDNITREVVINAIEKIDLEGVPKERKSKKYCVDFNGSYYPPKYVLSIANMIVNGVELFPNEFSGGKESNTYLRNLGFKIID